MIKHKKILRYLDKLVFLFGKEQLAGRTRLHIAADLFIRDIDSYFSVTEYVILLFREFLLDFLKKFIRN